MISSSEWHRYPFLLLALTNPSKYIHSRRFSILFLHILPVYILQMSTSDHCYRHHHLGSSCWVSGDKITTCRYNRTVLIWRYIEMCKIDKWTSWKLLSYMLMACKSFFRVVCCQEWNAVIRLGMIVEKCWIGTAATNC